MEYKYVDLSASVQMPVPKGLTPDEEATYIASRIGFVDFEELESQCRQMHQLSEDGKLTNFEDFLRDLEREYGQDNGGTS